MSTRAQSQQIGAGSAHLTKPPEDLYWAVIDPPLPAGPPGRRRSLGTRLLPPGLLPDLADQVPVPADELHAIITPARDGRIIICAIAIDDLRSLPSSVRSLAPARLPPFLAALTPAPPSHFNLLVGPFEPRSARRARAQRHIAAMTAALLLTALLVRGFARREHAASVHSQAARTAAAQIIAQAAPGATSPADLAAALKHARSIAAVDLEARRSPDAAAALASLLAAWPTVDQARSKPQSVTVAPDGATVALLIPGDPAPFLKAFKTPSGWTMDEPRLTAVDSQTRLTLRLTRAQPLGDRP